jgi:hypothetical protein
VTGTFTCAPVSVIEPTVTDAGSAPDPTAACGAIDIPGLIEAPGLIDIPPGMDIPAIEPLFAALAELCAQALSEAAPRARAANVPIDLVRVRFMSVPSIGYRSACPPESERGRRRTECPDSRRDTAGRRRSRKGCARRGVQARSATASRLPEELRSALAGYPATAVTDGGRKARETVSDGERERWSAPREEPDQEESGERRVVGGVGEPRPSGW